MNYQVINIVNLAHDEVVVAEFLECMDAIKFLNKKREESALKMFSMEQNAYKKQHGNGWIPLEITEKWYKSASAMAEEVWKLKEKA